MLLGIELLLLTRTLMDTRDGQPQKLLGGSMNPAVEMAYAVIDLHKEVSRLKAEVEHLTWFKDEYHKLMASNRAHNKFMCEQQFGLVLALCETDGLDALKKRTKK